MNIRFSIHPPETSFINASDTDKVYSTFEIQANPSKFSNKLLAVKNIYARIYFPSLISEINYGRKSSREDLANRAKSAFDGLDKNVRDIIIDRLIAGSVNAPSIKLSLMISKS